MTIDTLRLNIYFVPATRKNSKEYEQMCSLMHVGTISFESVFIFNVASSPKVV